MKDELARLVLKKGGAVWCHYQIETLPLDILYALRGKASEEEIRNLIALIRDVRSPESAIEDAHNGDLDAQKVLKIWKEKRAEWITSFEEGIKYA